MPAQVCRKDDNFYKLLIKIDSRTDFSKILSLLSLSYKLKYFSNFNFVSMKFNYAYFLWTIFFADEPDRKHPRSDESSSSKDDSTLHTSRDELCVGGGRLEHDERHTRDSTLDLSNTSKSPSTPNYRMDSLIDHKPLLASQYGRASCQYASSFGSPHYGLSPPSFASPHHSMYPYAAAAHHASLGAMPNISSHLSNTTSLTSGLDTSLQQLQQQSCQQIASSAQNRHSQLSAHAQAGLGYNMASGLTSSALSPCGGLMGETQGQLSTDPSAMNLKLKQSFANSLI